MPIKYHMNNFEANSNFYFKLVKLKSADLEIFALNFTTEFYLLIWNIIVERIKNKCLKIKWCVV